MQKNVLVLGTLDTKAQEFALLRSALVRQGVDVLMMDVGVPGDSGQKPDITSAEVAKAAGTSIKALRERNDRGHAMQAMAAGAAAIVKKLHSEAAFDAIASMGGTGGTSVACAAMRELPLGLPKVCVTTMAGSDTTGLVQGKDILLVPSIVDVAGINSISKVVIERAAGMVVAMLASPFDSPRDRCVIAATMFGNTTTCINACREHFEAAGNEVLVFHATGSGGRTMEQLIDQGRIDAVLDLTTTELADHLCAGIFSAGPDRLSAAGRRGIAQVIAPGCIDMVNYGAVDTVPKEYVDAGRKLHVWNSATTLMRTNVEENRKLGETIATKANKATGPVAVILPLRGVSILGAEGGDFHDPQCDIACFDAIRENLRNDLPCVEVDCTINDPQFSDRAIHLLEQLLAGAHDKEGVTTL